MPSVQRVKWAQFRVGIVCLVALVILSVILWLLTGGSMFTEKTTLYVYIPDATGLSQDSPVRVDGITVGKVASVALSGSTDPARVVRVTLTVLKETLASIPAESYAQLSFDDPVGDKYVDITSRGRGPRAPYSEITYKEQTDIMKSLDFATFNAQLRDLDAVISDIETGRSRVGQFVQGRQMYDDLRKRIGQIESDLRRAAATTDSVGEALYTDKLYRQISQPVKDLDQALAKLQSGQGLGQYLADSAQYEQIRAAVADLGAGVASFHRSDWMQSDEMYNSWTRGLAGLIQSVDQFRASPAMATSQTYDNLNGFALEMRDTLRDFRENPRKYLRLKVF